MLVIMRRADRDGGMGSSFTIGDMQVTLLWVGMFSIKLQVAFADGSVSVSTVPFNQTLKPFPGVVIMPMQVKASPFRSRTARLGIDAPKHLNIERDDMKQRRAA